jgi:outer membrane protein assembly factor BamD
MIHRNTKLAITLAMAIATAGCHHNNVKNPIANLDSKQPDKVLFDRAMEAMKHGKYDVARITLQTLINTYPDSEYIARAKLAVGDSWYAEGNAAAYQQAEVEYKDFETFFPNLPEAAEAQLKIANMHYNQMEKPDRDYTHAMRAEDEYRALIQQYPDSKLVPEAKQRLREVQEVLAERQYGIGRFYFLRESYPAAIARLKTLVDTYPLYSEADEALMMLGHANENEATLLKNSKMPEAPKMRLVNQYRADAGKAYARIIERYPGSDRADDARARLKELGQPIPKPTPEAIAEYKAEAQSRGESTRFHSVMSNFHKAPNDLVRAPHVGEPPLVDPPQTGAPDLIRASTLVAAGVPNAGNGKADVVSVTPGDTKNDPIPRSDATPQPDAAPPADAPPAGTAPASSSGEATPAAAPPTPASNSGTASDTGIGDLTPNIVSQPGQPSASGAAPAANLATPAQPSATDSPDAAGTSSSKTNAASDAPAQAPAQVNEIKNGADPSASAAPTSSSDDSASSSSKKKKKKGLKKIVPF